jgi:hypothetical protein
MLVCVVLTLLNTCIEWAAVFEGLSGSSEAKQGLALPLSYEPPSAHDDLVSLVTNATREVILIEPDMTLTTTIFKYFFNSGCGTMRNKANRNNCKRGIPNTKLDKILKNIVQLDYTIPVSGVGARSYIQSELPTFQHPSPGGSSCVLV